jgi:uncharacterized protein YcbX
MYDRRWMLVDESNLFITQRNHPQMALLQVDINCELITIKHSLNKIPPITIQAEPQDKEETDVTIWKDIVPAIEYGNEVSNWFTEAIDFKCRLVYMPDATKRKVDLLYSKNRVVSFADGYPLLIIGEESLNDLNGRMGEAVPMNRFRPNLVFSGGKPFEEDNWKKFRISEVNFHSVKPCARCVITTIDGTTAEKGKEPLRTLAAYRKKDGKVLFGMNLIPTVTGKVQLGNEIEIIE